MLTYKDILFSATKKLSDKFNCDVIVENKEGTFENECFYVTLIPVTNKASTLKTNHNYLIYYHQNILLITLIAFD